MAGINLALSTEQWVKVEPDGWVRPTGWAMVVVAVGIWPFRMYPFYWLTGMRIDSIADPVIVAVLSLVAALAAMVLFSQPRMAQAQKDAGVVEIERGFTQVQELSVPFAEVTGVALKGHPLFPAFTRVLVQAKGGKSLVFAWTTDKDEAEEIAGRIRGMVGTGAPATQAAAPPAEPTS